MPNKPDPFYTHYIKSGGFASARRYAAMLTDYKQCRKHLDRAGIVEHLRSLYGREEMEKVVASVDASLLVDPQVWRYDT